MNAGRPGGGEGEQPEGFALWLAGARVKTLPAAAVPVAVGTAAAVLPDAGWDGSIIWWRAALALMVALALQIGTNYANDYSDGIRGTDEDRVGPLRLVGSGLVEPSMVKRAAFACFGAAGVAGLILAAAVGWELLIVGVLSIAAGWFYTGGSRPYGYMGLGEVFVFVFFGLVATAGSTYVQRGELTGLSVIAGCAVGCLACALLVINNLRDIPSDTESGKNTLAVRLGDGRTRVLYGVLMAGPFVLALIMVPERRWAIIALGAVPAVLAPVRTVRSEAKGTALIPVLGGTGRAQMVFGLLLSIGLWISGVS